MKVWIVELDGHLYAFREAEDARTMVEYILTVDGDKPDAASIEECITEVELQ